MGLAGPGGRCLVGSGLVSRVVVNSIGATRTRAGLAVTAELDTASYPVGNSISRQQLAALPIRPHEQRGTWNYTIEPASPAAGTRPARRSHELARSAALAMLADPRLTGMTAAELDTLARRLAPLQAAQAEQRKYHQRGGPRRQAKGDHRQPLLPDPGRVLITVVYLRQVCSQKVLAEMLAINPNSIGQAIAQTRKLLTEQHVTLTQTTLLFRTTQQPQDWLDHGPVPTPMHPSATLSHPSLTGMSRTDLQAMTDRIALAYAAAIEQRRHRQRGGDRLPGTRGGVFRQKITDADRILATVLSQRQLCNQQTLADLFGTSRATIRNAIRDVQPLLEEHGYLATPATSYYRTPADLLASVPAEEPGPPR
jgi:Rhodopirellula transposase DDE domain